MSIPFTISVISGKGGVGKTTLSLNLARELSHFYDVWLVDIDLFNRGATSALWESEREIPFSVAQLILLPDDMVRENPQLKSAERGERAAAFAKEIRKYRAKLVYDETLAFLPAARTAEGRAASYVLWRGLNDEHDVLSAAQFLRTLIAAIGEDCSNCIVVFDGHGGLDDLSLAAANVSDICYIVNEPDLVTFTGSLTLYREIRDTMPERHSSIEFLINRVPPNRSVREMEHEFGDILSTITKSSEPVKAYFPLERELFGVFGDDPFVYEIYSRYWFSRKIKLVAHEAIEEAHEKKRLDPEKARNANVFVEPPGRREKKRRRAVRIALKREFHQRGDLLLMGWLVFAVALLSAVFTVYVQPEKVTPTSITLGSICTIAFVCIAVATWRWLEVQAEHISNERRLRHKENRRLRFGASTAARMRTKAELESGRKAITRNIRLGIAAAIVVIVGVVFAVPNILKAAARSKEKRTMADMRTIATALEARATDTNEYPDSRSIEQLALLLQPTYIKTTPQTDGWGTNFIYNSWESQYYAFTSAGADKKFEKFDPRAKVNAKDSATKNFDCDIVYSNGTFIRYPEGMVTE